MSVRFGKREDSHHGPASRWISQKSICLLGGVIFVSSGISSAVRRWRLRNRSLVVQRSLTGLICQSGLPVIPTKEKPKLAILCLVVVILCDATSHLPMVYVPQEGGIQARREIVQEPDEPQHNPKSHPRSTFSIFQCAELQT